MLYPFSRLPFYLWLTVSKKACQCNPHSSMKLAMVKTELLIAMSGHCFVMF